MNSARISRIRGKQRTVWRSIWDYVGTILVFNITKIPTSTRTIMTPKAAISSPTSAMVAWLRFLTVQFMGYGRKTGTTLVRELALPTTSSAMVRQLYAEGGESPTSATLGT